MSKGVEKKPKWIGDAIITRGYHNLNDCRKMKMKRMSMTSPSMNTSQMPFLNHEMVNFE